MPMDSHYLFRASLHMQTPPHTQIYVLDEGTDIIYVDPFCICKPPHTHTDIYVLDEGTDIIYLDPLCICKYLPTTHIYMYMS